MNAEQKAVVLDAAREMQHNDEYWLEFELKFMGLWQPCGIYTNPIRYTGSGLPEFRRKTKTITVTIPKPDEAIKTALLHRGVVLAYTDESMEAVALAAIREAMGEVTGNE